MSRVVTGLVLILAGGLIAVVPQFILPVCESAVATASGGSVPMKCFWTARAELGTGALIVFGGLLLCVCKDAGTRFGAAAVTAAAALLAVAFPTVLIGVCGSETMACRMGTLPALVLLGAFAFLVSLLACRSSARAAKKEGRR